MDAKAAIKSNMNLSTMVLKAYIGDLESADLMRRPGEECNHLAWQLGHLISSEVQLLQGLAQSANSLDPDSVAAGVDLPAGFAEKHSKEEYEALFDSVRAASAAALEQVAGADLDADAPEQLRSFCPTVGDVFNLIASHPMMHAGQFVIVRRKLGKPIVM